MIYLVIVAFVLVIFFATNRCVKFYRQGNGYIRGFSFNKLEHYVYSLFIALYNYLQGCSYGEVKGLYLYLLNEKHDDCLASDIVHREKYHDQEIVITLDIVSTDDGICDCYYSNINNSYVSKLYKAIASAKEAIDRSLGIISKDCDPSPELLQEYYGMT